MQGEALCVKARSAGRQAKMSRKDCWGQAVGPGTCLWPPSRCLMGTGAAGSSGPGAAGRPQSTPESCTL